MARSSDFNFLKALITDKTFQAREIRRVIKLGMIYLAITTVIVGVLYHLLLSQLFSSTSPLLFVGEDEARAHESLPSVSTLMAFWMMGMLAINTLISIALGVYLTRKLGHPLMAIKRALREIGNGNLYVRLRSSDKNDFADLAAELNTAMHCIRTQVETAQQSVAKIQEIPAPQELELQDITHNNALDDCRSALEFFNTEDPLEEIDEAFLKIVGDDNNNKVA